MKGNNTSSFKTQVTKGFIWATLERFSSRIVLFILQLILARILVPEDYGLCALLLIFINISTILITSGFPSSLIQKKVVTSLDYSSVLYFCLTIAFLLYILLYVASPFVADFFNDERMVKMLRVLAIILPIGAYNSLQITILKRDLKFKPIFIANFTAALISAIISIYMAYKKQGAWAIIYQYIINIGVITLILFLYIRWIPKLEFSLNNIKQIYSFGWKYMVTSLTASIATDIYTGCIGKVFNKSQLGTFDTGNKISQTITDTVTSGLSSVLFPVFSKLQDSPQDIKLYLRKANQYSCFIIFPLILGLIPLSTPLVKLILTEKWIGAVPYMQISCLMFMLYPLHYTNMQAIAGSGHAGKALKIELLKKTSQLIILAITLPFTLMIVAIGRVLSSYIELYIIMKPNKNLIAYSPSQQFKDVIGILIISLFATGGMYGIHCIYSYGSLYIEVLLQLIVGISMYLLLSKIFNNHLYTEVLTLLKKHK